MGEQEHADRLLNRLSPYRGPRASEDTSRSPTLVEELRKATEVDSFRALAPVTKSAARWKLAFAGAVVAALLAGLVGWLIHCG